MAVGGQIAGANKNAINPQSAAQANDIDQMQAKINELKNL